jgi:alpha-beta hydrolase superfamily lysophospholipase
MTREYREGTTAGAQGLNLFWRCWTAPEPTSAVLLVHGLGEHSGRYGAFATTLAEHGTSVFSFDLRGHGRSGGTRGDVDAFPRYLEDLLGMEQVMARQVPEGVPGFLMGHSMGGLIVLRRLQVFRGSWAGAIFSAPWLATPLPGLLRSFGRFLGVALPGVPLPAGVDAQRLTRDPDMIRAWREDPLIHTRITGRLFKEAEREQQKALVSSWPRDLPALFLVPDDDPVVKGSVTIAFAKTLAGTDVRLEVLEGRRHEPLNDLGREEVNGMVLDWLSNQVDSG